MGTKEVIVELPTGARWGVASVAQAKNLFPSAKIVSYGDGAPYTEEKKPAAPRKRTSGGSKRSKPAATGPASPETVPVTTGEADAPGPENTDGPDQG